MPDAPDVKDKLCYVLPYYSESDSQHYARIPNLLVHVARSCDLFIIVEQGGAAPRVPGATWIAVQRTPRSQRVRRYLELLRLAQKVRRAGCRRFFVRISKGAALLLIIARPMLDIEVFYWNSGQARKARLIEKDTGLPRESLAKRFSFRTSDALLGFLARNADRFVTGPESMVGYYENEYRLQRQRTLTLYNDVDTELFHPLVGQLRDERRRALGLPMNEPCVLFVGRASRLKGGGFLEPIGATLRRQGIPGQIVVVGDISSPRLASRLRVEPRVGLVGPQTGGDVASYMQSADLFILPSLSEGFPRVLIEAMACGLPVAAFDVGGVREILGPLQSQFIVPIGDVEGIARAVQKILGDRSLSAELARENLKAVQRFSTDAVARMFLETIVRS